MTGDTPRRRGILFWLAIATFLGLLWQIWRGEHPQPQDPVNLPLPVRTVGDETEQAYLAEDRPLRSASSPVVNPRHDAEAKTAEETLANGSNEPVPAQTMPAGPISSPPPTSAPMRTQMSVGSNPLGLTAAVSRPIIQANKWTVMTVIVTLRTNANGLIALPADIHYKMPGWIAEVGGSGAPCTSNNDRVQWPAERGATITISAGEEIALPVEFTCGDGGDFKPRGTVTIHLQLFADVGGGPRPIRMSANDVAYTMK